MKVTVSELFKTATSLQHLRHPNNTTNAKEQMSFCNRILGVALFALSGLATMGIMYAVYLITAYKKMSKNPQSPTVQKTEKLIKPVFDEKKTKIAEPLFVKKDDLVVLKNAEKAKEAPKEEIAKENDIQKPVLNEKQVKIEESPSVKKDELITPKNVVEAKEASKEEIAKQEKLENENQQVVQEAKPIEPNRQPNPPPPEPALLAFGQFRKWVVGGEAPNFSALNDVIETEMLQSAGLACCFHTTESQPEIWNLIKDTRIKDDLKNNPMAHYTGPKKYYAQSYGTLYNNLVRLHDALPGDPKTKSAKIYWNDRVEQTLFPYFFHNEEVDVNDLVFALTPGEGGASVFQAAQMDFTKQLQFVGIGKEKIMGDLNKEIEDLSQEVFRKNILQEIENEAAEANPLMAHAKAFTLRNNLKDNLLAMKAEPKKFNFDLMTEEERNQLINKKG